MRRNPENDDVEPPAAAPLAPAPAPAPGADPFADCEGDTHAAREQAFDRHLETRWRWPSEIHWSPISVCRRAAQLLAPRPGERVLDVGSGVGKFCVVGACLTGATFVGVEQREHLVRQARRAAAALDVANVQFLCGDALAVDWTQFACLYLYNPFAECDYTVTACIDDTLPQSEELYLSNLTRALRKLEQLPPGTRVATWHGFGYDFPEGYERTASEEHGTGTLELWLRTSH